MSNDTATQTSKIHKGTVDGVPVPITKGMPDYGNAQESRGITLQRVGLDRVDFPLSITTKEGGAQGVAAVFNMYGHLPQDVKGTHMSRFSETLMSFADTTLSGANFGDLASLLRDKLESRDVYVNAAFKYFVPKLSPVSKRKGVMAYKCRFTALVREGKYDFIEEIQVPVQILCPCSKELALTDAEKGEGKGAHNQRCIVTVQVKTIHQPGPWLEDLVELIDSCASVPLFPILKREDEKYVTICGYENPRFVEDITRDVALKLQGVDNIDWLRVKSESFESIHDYSAVAYAGREKTNGEWGESSASFY